MASLLFCLVVTARLSATQDPAEIPAPESAAPTLDKADTAWMLVSTCLVMFMIPGLALFYGGISRRKNLLGTMMQSMIALSVVGLLWGLIGYSLAFGRSQGGWIGWSPEWMALAGVKPPDVFANSSIPVYLHCMYQGMFAIITPALISGAIAERVRFLPYCIFIAAWSLLVYCPLAHWVWAIDGSGTPVGVFGAMGALDFAGGTVVHIAAGVAGLTAALLLRPRLGYPEQAMHPSSMVLTLVGAGMLWFGWFGFNGGSGLGVGNGLAATALTATQLAASSAGAAWTIIEWIHRGKPTALGFATGVVAGLVGITPAAAFVSPWAAIVIGLVTAGVCYVMVWLKPRLKYDDSLDAFGVHGVGGFVGALLTGVFANALHFGSAIGDPSASLGALGDSGTDRLAQILVQLKASLGAIVFSFVATAVLVKVIDMLVGFHLKPGDEQEGLDSAVHGEVAFDFGISPEQTALATAVEPRPAATPPESSRRFAVVLDGVPTEELLSAWGQMCQAGDQPPSADFRNVYPHVTTVSGNRFRFRGGDPDLVSRSLTRLFEDRFPNRKLIARVEM